MYQESRNMAKKFLISTLLLACVLLAVADDTLPNVQYEYDASGNRILRQLVQQRSNQSPRQQQTTFIVYPTIVTDVLNVIAHEEIVPNEFHYTIANVSGNIVLSGNILSQSTQLQLSLSQGYYILNIVSSTEQYSFNFLKN